MGILAAMRTHSAIYGTLHQVIVAFLNVNKAPERYIILNILIRVHQSLPRGYKKTS